ncbi:MAG: hypothetical protein FWD94_07065 [Treponema sp.]|nr:hypothetical protein [Treponema sp.]
MRRILLPLLCLALAACDHSPEDDGDLLSDVPQVLRGTWKAEDSTRTFSSDTLTSSFGSGDSTLTINASVIEVRQVAGKAGSEFPTGYKITSVWTGHSSVPQLEGQKAVDYCFVSTDGKRMWIDNGLPSTRNTYEKQ